MAGKLLDVQSLSRAAKPVAGSGAGRHRNWTHLSVFVILTVAMMAALAGLGVLLFVLIDQFIALFR